MPGRFDALLPDEMAKRAEAIGAKKAAQDGASLFVLSLLAGAFIALGGVAATTMLSGSGGLPWGLQRMLAGTVFSLGLILVVVGGAELFTGNNLIVMAWASRRIAMRLLLRNWVIVYAGNFVGAVATALLVFGGEGYAFGGGAFGTAAIGIAHSKLQFGFWQAVTLGILCNGLVCLAIWLSYSARTTTDRILAIVPPISTFVAAGFEHSIANMYFIPLALFIADFDQTFVAAMDLTAKAEALTWSGFLLKNLLPVTIGNLIGGTFLVGGVYWFVYLRPRGALQRQV